MTKKLDGEIARSVRVDARRAEAEVTGPYPEGTTIRQPNRPSRMFNLRLSDEQFGELQELARRRHLPVSTMARAWLLERLDCERRAS
jgi:hypothetical protein